MPPNIPGTSLVIGINFDTFASGVAYHVLPEGPLARKAGSSQEVRIMQQWPGEHYPYAKTRTAVLYKE